MSDNVETIEINEDTVIEEEKIEEEKPEEEKVEVEKPKEVKTDKKLTELNEDQIQSQNPVMMTFKSRTEGFPDVERELKQLVHRDFDGLIKSIIDGIFRVQAVLGEDLDINKNPIGVILLFFNYVREEFSQFLCEWLDLDYEWFDENVSISEYLSIVKVILEQNEVDRIIENFTQIWGIMKPALNSKKKGQ